MAFGESSKSGKVRSGWGNEVGLASGGAGGSALRARSGSMAVILGVVGSHGQGMVSLVFEMAPQLPCKMRREGRTGDGAGDWNGGQARGGGAADPAEETD